MLSNKDLVLAKQEVKVWTTQGFAKKDHTHPEYESLVTQAEEESKKKIYTEELAYNAPASGSSLEYELTYTPNKVMQLTVNGVVYYQDYSFTVNGKTITWTDADYTPNDTAECIVTYEYTDDSSSGWSASSGGGGDAGEW